MPYVSNKQRKFFHANVGKKGITPAVVSEFDNASKGLSLPERAAIRRKSAGKRVKKMGGTPIPQSSQKY